MNNLVQCTWKFTVTEKHNNVIIHFNIMTSIENSQSVLGFHIFLNYNALDWVFFSKKKSFNLIFSISLLFFNPVNFLSRLPITLIMPLGWEGSDHFSSRALPFSFFSTVKLLRPLGEASKVRTDVQGLETCPALFTATTWIWYVVKGFNPNKWAWCFVPWGKNTDVWVS